MRKSCCGWCKRSLERATPAAPPCHVLSLRRKGVPAAPRSALARLTEPPSTLRRVMHMLEPPTALVSPRILLRLFIDRVRKVLRLVVN